MNRAQFLMRFEELTHQMTETMLKKNSDYAGHEVTNDPFHNFRVVEKLGVTTLENGIVVRMCDKLARVSSLMAKAKENQGPSVADETIKDTLLDIANYAVILAVALERDSTERDSTPGNARPKRLSREAVDGQGAMVTVGLSGKADDEWQPLQIKLLENGFTLSNRETGEDVHGASFGAATVCKAMRAAYEAGHDDARKDLRPD